MARTKVVFKKWVPDTYPDRIQKLLQNYSPLIGQQFQTEIKAVRFSWPNTTERQNGEVVSTPRNIVDTGDFLRSQQPGKVSSSGAGTYSLSFKWTAPYALAIYLGYYNYRFEPKKVRNWIKFALEAVPTKTFFEDNWNQVK